MCLYTHLIKELQHDSKNVRVGLVYFIKQDNGIGTRLQQLGQLTPFLMSHVSRWGANELCHLREEEERVQNKQRSTKSILPRSHITFNVFYAEIHKS